MVEDDESDEAVKPAVGRFGALWQAFARRPYIHVALLCAMFAGVVGAGAYAHKDPHGFFQSMGFGSGTGNAKVVEQPAPPIGASSTPADDPVKHFAKTGMGQVVFSEHNSDNCKRALFDNRTGSYKEMPDVFCGKTPDDVNDSQSNARVQSMRKGFNR
jgi:hypothetical protein